MGDLCTNIYWTQRVRVLTHTSWRGRLSTQSRGHRRPATRVPHPEPRHAPWDRHPSGPRGLSRRMFSWLHTEGNISLCNGVVKNRTPISSQCLGFPDLNSDPVQEEVIVKSLSGLSKYRAHCSRRGSHSCGVERSPHPHPPPGRGWSLNFIWWVSLRAHLSHRPGHQHPPTITELQNRGSNHLPSQGRKVALLRVNSKCLHLRDMIS